MLEKVKKDLALSVAVKNVPVLTLALARGVENVAEKLGAKLTKEKILCFEMSVKGGSAHVGSLDYLADGYLRETFFG